MKFREYVLNEVWKDSEENIKARNPRMWLLKETFKDLEKKLSEVKWTFDPTNHEITGAIDKKHSVMITFARDEDADEEDEDDDGGEGDISENFEVEFRDTSDSFKHGPFADPKEMIADIKKMISKMEK